MSEAHLLFLDANVLASPVTRTLIIAGARLKGGMSLRTGLCTEHRLPWVPTFNDSLMERMLDAVADELSDDLSD
ncbi:hypothetical protein [Propionimicrobium sp. PCR01-08-3]|uniref:hypothetical protein n=1 Tax=Propionimicrobium sp. PCR01-08-3 TaxID=3052086 RepID=UPI00255C5D5D|nr:hypothetical protein [Propionimicrobium sp. PCR01-08-3]WIY82154.1 hypothetical protein QQ658_11665 [Propionimicrobium sp. PCR01-08-3]